MWGRLSCYGPLFVSRCRLAPPRHQYNSEVRQFLLRATRRLLKEVDIRIERTRSGARSTPRPGNGHTAALTSFFTSLALPPDAQAYLQGHLARLVRTLSLVPPNGRRALELGCYVYPSAALQRVLGYQQVRGAYYAPIPASDHKELAIPGESAFHLDVDLFDAERHTFPYADATFDLVLCTELIEHLLADPMHLLCECHRVLEDGGLLLITTPNTASLQSVACTLHGWHNPQIYSAYPAPGHHGIPHVREYTASELQNAVIAAGFEIEALFTERLPGVDEGGWVLPLLERGGFDTSLRGEQTYCLARRRAHLPRQRHPPWLYAG